MSRGRRWTLTADCPGEHAHWRTNPHDYVDAELERIRAAGRKVRPDILSESQQSDWYAKV